MIPTPGERLVDGLLLRPATPEDAPGILRLFRASFGREVAPEVWEWLAHRCPCGPARTTVIEDARSGELAGSYTLLPILLRVGSRVVPATLCNNVSTHPAWQGLGLFTRIGHFALEREREIGIPFAVGMPNAKALPGHRKVGWQELCRLHYLVKRDCRPSIHSCIEVDAFDERLDVLMHEVSARFSFLVMKDHRFLNWRVAQRPDRRYTRYALLEGERMLGYAVVKRFDEEGYRKTHILDVQAIGDDALHELLAACETHAVGRDELNLWTNPCNPFDRLLRERGFTVQEGPDRLIVHSNFGEMPTISEGGWWFCFADNDVY